MFIAGLVVSALFLSTMILLVTRWVLEDNRPLAEAAPVQPRKRAGSRVAARVRPTATRDG